MCGGVRISNVIARLGNKRLVSCYIKIASRRMRSKRMKKKKINECSLVEIYVIARFTVATTLLNNNGLHKHTAIATNTQSARFNIVVTGTHIRLWPTIFYWWIGDNDGSHRHASTCSRKVVVIIPNVCVCVQSLSFVRADILCFADDGCMLVCTAAMTRRVHV